MDVLHVVLAVEGTTIPVEIAAAVDEHTDVSADVVAEAPPPDPLPDTVSADQVLADHCGFDDYGALLAALGDEYDAVHTHHVGPAARVGLRSAVSGLHHVNTQHGHLHYSLRERVQNVPGLLTADTVVYNSHCTADSYNLLERACKRRADERVVHNGVNARLTEAYRATVADEPTRVVTAARLIPRKNLATLVRAMAHVEGMSLQVVGDGPAKADLERVAADAGVADRVAFPGYLPEREDVYDAFAESDVFALPSHGEGFCVAVAEAMAVGLPVVVSDLPIFHEVVGERGVFVDRTDPAAVAEGLAGLREDPDRARAIGAANRDRIREQFTLQRCAEGYADVYRQIEGA